MSGLEFVWALLALAEFSYKVVTKSILFATSAGSQYRSARFGLAGDLLYFMRLVDTDRLQEMHWNINLWTDKEILAWRDSYVMTCNAVPVAGAIFASIGLTVLQLLDMYTVHWSARALCVTSMFLGVLSVMMATSQQQAVAMLNNPISIRLWLSRGRPKAYGLKIGPVEAPGGVATVLLRRQRPGATLPKFEFVEWVKMMSTRIHEEGAQKPRTLFEWLALMRDCAREQRQQDHVEFRTDWREQDKYKDIEPFKGMPLESSISVLKAVAMPRHLLDLAVLVFVVGFGLYLLFSWVEDMGGQPVANRNVFIVFIVSVGTFVLYYSYIVSIMVDNQDKKAKEFDLLDLGGPHKPAALEELEKDLEEVQQRMKTLAEQRVLIESQIQGIVRTSHETG